LVQRAVGEDVAITTVPTDDNRSYHISSEKIRRELGFVPKRSVGDAVGDLVSAFGAGKIPNPLTDIGYYNIKMMQQAKLK
jgi:nucleoside-diphosphate-sugar epimerase